MGGEEQLAPVVGLGTFHQVHAGQHDAGEVARRQFVVVVLENHVAGDAGEVVGAQHDVGGAYGVGGVAREGGPGVVLGLDGQVVAYGEAAVEHHCGIVFGTENHAARRSEADGYVVSVAAERHAAVAHPGDTAFVAVGLDAVLVAGDDVQVLMTLDADFIHLVGDGLHTLGLYGGRGEHGEGCDCI